MNAMLIEECDFDARAPESNFSISLAENFDSVEIDYSGNPNLLLEIEEFRDVIGLRSPVQAGFLVNVDQSCWLTNLGRAGSTEVYRPRNKTYRKLTHNQVAYLRKGDYVGFYGAFFRVEFSGRKIILIPLHIIKRIRATA